jgi:Pentapeptide repeats (8 copies)
MSIQIIIDSNCFDKGLNAPALPLACLAYDERTCPPKGAAQMSEQQGQRPPQIRPDAYGQPISEGRQAELQRYLDQWAAETDHGERKGPLDGIILTGSDVSWLADQSGRNVIGAVPDLHLEGADLRWAHLVRADLTLAYLEGAVLNRAHLEGAEWPRHERFRHG